jgi:hypothetical protein
MAKLKKYLVDINVSQQHVYEIEANNKWSAEILAYQAYHKEAQALQTTEPFIKLSHIVIKEK